MGCALAIRTGLITSNCSKSAISEASGVALDSFAERGDADLQA
jgi:hypothetical protein